MAVRDTFRGYGPEQGYSFLIDAVIKNDFVPKGIHFEPGEIFINDGAKAILETLEIFCGMIIVSE